MNGKLTKNILCSYKMMNDKIGKTQVKLTKSIHVQSKSMIDLETNKWKVDDEFRLCLCKHL